MEPERRALPRVATRDRHGVANGWLIPIVNKHEGTGPFALSRDVEQVYVTSISPRTVKGPHLHLRRSGFFTAIVGRAHVVIRCGDDYRVFESDSAVPATIYVPAGTPSALVNASDSEAIVLNVVESAWRPEDPDDEPVEDFDFDFQTLVERHGRS